MSSFMGDPGHGAQGKLSCPPTPVYGTAHITSFIIYTQLCAKSFTLLVLKYVAHPILLFGDQILDNALENSYRWK